jgi:hypothetical protein
MARYAARAKDPETGVLLYAEVGWAEGGYWVGVWRDDNDTRSIYEAADIATLPLLIAVSRPYVIWDRQLYQALRDAPVADHLKADPNGPVSKIIRQLAAV